MGLFTGFPGGSVIKNPPANAGDIKDSGSTPASESSPRGGNGNPLQYSYLESSMDRGAWQATIHGAAKSQTGLSDGRAREQEYLHDGNWQMTGIKHPLPPLARESNQHTTACPNEDP